MRRSPTCSVARSRLWRRCGPSTGFRPGLVTRRCGGRRDPARPLAVALRVVRGVRVRRHAGRGARGLRAALHGQAQGEQVNETTTIPVSSVRFVKELYPRLKPHDDAVERYRDAIDNLPPIVVARDGVLVDGYHRWQAHVREGLEQIRAVNLGNLTDAEIVRESIRRNATHGQQLSQKDKQRMAGQLWTTLAHLTTAERVKEIAELLSVSERSVQSWTKDVRKAEKEAQQAKAWDLWLDCLTEREIADAVGVTQPTVNDWLIEKRKSAVFYQAPESRQHFDVWQFPTPDWESGGQRSYFGAVPPQVVENLLWFFTDPGDIVVDLFAG